MPVKFKDNRVVFLGVVGADEAEGLVGRLQQNPAAQADLSACTHMHPANLQVLMAAGTKVWAWPVAEELGVWLKTALPSE